MCAITDFPTDETMGDIIGVCVANSRTTDNRVIGRRRLPMSLLDTSIQLSPSVHLRVRCKAERTFFAEEDSLYIDCRQQRRFCLRTVANRYPTLNQTCDKLKNIMAIVDAMAPRSALPKMNFPGPYENCSSGRKVLPSYLPPAVSTVSVCWMWRRQMLRLCNMLPGSCAFDASCGEFPYARFLMLCFWQTFRHSATYNSGCFSDTCCRSSVCGSCSCNSTSMSTTECKPLIGNHSSVAYEHETETTDGNSSLMYDSGGADYNMHDVVGDCEVVPHRNAYICDFSSKNTEKMPSQLQIVPNHSATASHCAAAVNDDDDVLSDNKATFVSDSVVISPSPATPSSIDQNQPGSWSFFVRASDSDISDCSDDDDGSDDIDSDAVSDDSSDNCWDDDDDDDDDCSPLCLLPNLDPLKINGLYIPPTSKVPVSQSCCLSLPMDSAAAAAEVESESERTLRNINDTWRQCYDDDVGDVKMKQSSPQLHTKHVQFSSESPVEIVTSNDEEWSTDYQAARVGHWETMARDRTRFMKRIEQTEQIISWIFTPQHRCRILTKLHQQPV